MKPPNVQAFPGAVVVTGTALQTATDAVLIAIRSRRANGLPRSASLDDLAAAFITAMSPNGHVDVPNMAVPTQLPTVTIEEAAHRMNKSRRQVRRMAPKLGGRIIAGRWLLDETAIAEHLDGQHG